MSSIHSSGVEEVVSECPDGLDRGVGKWPRTNAKLLHRFYEPLQLLYILNADRGPGEVDLPPTPRSRDFKVTLRRFLDDLSWLCDNKHGGETVSAVAAQESSEGPKFWLVSRYEASFLHLQWVLTEIKGVRGETSEKMTVAALHIAQRSIGFSRDKINNYTRFLKRAIEQAKKIRRTSRVIELVDPAELDLLFIELEDLVKDPSDHLNLCRAARLFRQRKILASLLRTHNSPESRSPWASLWHFLGRLGCWFPKCQNIVLTACQFPQLLEDVRCDFLALPQDMKLPVDQSKASLEWALRRMFPSDQQDMAGALHEQLSGLRVFDIPDVFYQNLTNDRLKGRVHAEVYLMEHFYFNRLHFLGQEKYIGCSKPSCYCCSLYMRFHPAHVVLRPAHNNIYVSWIPPLRFQLNQEQKAKHNLDIMNQMNAYIRRDVREEIEERVPRREKAPDSTTGADLFSFLSQ